MRILFLNQFFPPDAAPTGVLLHELAERLQARGHEVEFISAGQSYRGKKESGRRIVREARALLTMLGHGLRARKPDLVFSATSPPCLLIAATWIAKWHGARSVHWAMDLYPEIAAALGELRDGVVTRLIRQVMEWSYRQADAVIALDEDMRTRISEYGVKSVAIVRPWITGGGDFRFSVRGPSRTGVGRADFDFRAEGGMFTWIYSGNLGRAHEWETLLEAQRILEGRGLSYRLLFQGGGSAWTAARERAASLGLRNVEWRDYAAQDELAESLLRCQALVVTQRPETQGLLWPSKLALILALGRPILFVGPLDGAIARLLSGEREVGGPFGCAQGRLRPPLQRDGEVGGHRPPLQRDGEVGGPAAAGPPLQNGIFAPGDAAGVADWLERRGGGPFVVAAMDSDPAGTREAGMGILTGIVERIG